MTLNLDDLEAIARKTDTPGPWETRCEGYKEPTRVCHDSEAVIYLGYDYWADFTEGDAEHIATFDPPTVLALIAKLREAEAEAARYKSAIRRALAFESVLPAIATEPRRMLTAALAYKPTNQENGRES